MKAEEYTSPQSGKTSLKVSVDTAKNDNQPEYFAEKYRNDALNPYFTSNLEDFIKQHKNIKLWACGHTHIPFECKIGECKVVCEPYGYYGVDHWLQPKDYNGKIIEL